MSRNLLLIACALVCAGAAAAGLSWWASAPGIPVEARTAGMDGYSPELAFERVHTDIAGQFKQFSGTPGKASGAWTAFRGTDRSNVVTGISLADTWPQQGPSILWSISLGQGYAAPAVLDGRVFVLDYLEEEQADALRCFSLDNGEEIWRRSYSVKVKNDHGMSRTIPAVTADYTVTIGPMGHVMCVNTVSGVFKWGIDLIREYGTKRPPWHTGQCPLIENGTAVIAPAGTEVLMMGIDCATGEVNWQTPNTGQWDMSHSSIMPMSVNGVRMYVYAAIGGMAGVSAQPGSEGELLWQTTLFDKAVIAPSPVDLGEGRLLITAGYGAGSMLMQIGQSNGVWQAETLQECSPKQGLALEQQSPIVYQDLVFGIMPKDGGGLRKQFVCVRSDDITSFRWSSGKEHRFGLGPFMLADNKFYILDDNGWLTMARFSATGFEFMDKARVLQGHEAWGPLALAGTRMLVRDLTHLACIELGNIE